MKTRHLKTAAKSAVLVTVLSCAVGLRAATPSTPQTLGGVVTGQNQFQTVDFSEARALTRAYLILATGDHDYRGHRMKAMHQIEAAGKLLFSLDGAGYKKRFYGPTIKHLKRLKAGSSTALNRSDNLKFASLKSDAIVRGIRPVNHE